jgi:DNA-directed RNA polymerase specialized sigma24 family protein
MFTILFLLPTLGALFGVAAEHPGNRLRAVAGSDADEVDQHFSQIEKAQSLADFHRRAFIETAQAWWPEQAFDAEIRHFLLPLFDAARNPYDGHGTEVSYHSPLDWGRLFSWSQVQAAWAQDGQDVFAECVKALYPSNVGKAARSVRRNYRLSDDDSDDVALGALLSICKNYGTRAYPNLLGAYFLTVGRDAKKRVDPNRKYRREVTSSALGSMFTDCGEPADFVESCPSPWASPEEQAAQWEEISLVKWCDLSRLQRTVILQKAILGMSDEEISNLHTGMRPVDAKNTYQNARRKVRDELASACQDRRW